MTKKDKGNSLTLTPQEEHVAWVELFIYCLRENKYLKQHLLAKKQGDMRSLISSNLLYWQNFDPEYYENLNNIEQSRLSELPNKYWKDLSETEQIKLELICSRVPLLEDLLSDFSEFIDCNEQELFNRLDSSNEYNNRIARKLLIPNSQNPQLQIVRDGNTKQCIGNKSFIEENCLIIKLPLGQEIAETKKLADMLIQGAFYHGGENIPSREFSKKKNTLIPNHHTRFEYDNPVDKKRGWTGNYQFCAINRDLNKYITIILCWHLHNKVSMSEKEIAIFLVQHQNRMNDQFRLIGYKRKFPLSRCSDEEFMSLFSDNSAEYRQANIFKYVCKWIKAGQQIIDNIASASFPLHKPIP